MNKQELTMNELSDKEILIMMTTKCADLERQLKEARENELRFLNKLIPDSYPMNSFEVIKYVNKRIKQLKEKGE